MTETLSPSAQRVQDALKALGFANTVIEHEQTTRSAKDAAQAIGCAVGQIVKSLIFVTHDSRRPALILVSGPNRVNELRMGQLIGETLERADPDFVQAVTGFAIGGVPPIGLGRRRHPACRVQAHPARTAANDRWSGRLSSLICINCSNVGCVRF